MAAALPTVGSLVAGAGAGASTFGTALSIAGTAISGFARFKAQRNAGRAEQLAAEAKERELRLDAKKQETQSAIEEADRQRRLRVTLAEQRARFGGAGVDVSSGSPLRIAERTQSEIARQDRQAGLFSSLTVSSINRQGQEELRAGSAARSAANSRAFGSLIQTTSTVAGQIGDLRDVT